MNEREPTPDLGLEVPRGGMRVVRASLEIGDSQSLVFTDVEGGLQGFLGQRLGARLLAMGTQLHFSCNKSSLGKCSITDFKEP